MELFGGLKTKLQLVQENLSSSLRGLTVSETDGVKPQNINLRKEHPKVNLYAGVDVLQSFQNDWAELHKLATKNAEAAEVADNCIKKLLERVVNQHHQVDQLASALAHIHSTLHDLDIIMEKLGLLDTLVVSVEDSLIELTEQMERRELDERELEERYRLAVHGERRLAQLEAARTELAASHARRVVQHESRLAREMRDRQLVCDAQFREDLKAYKESRVLPGNTVGKSSSDKGTVLEEVTLEDDEPTALDDFLKQE